MYLLSRLDRDRRVTAVPYQKPGFPEFHGLTVEDCREAVWAITPDGKRHRAAEGANVALATATKSLFPMALYKVPPIGYLQEIVYARVARNRSRFSGVVAYCSDHPGECGRNTVS